MPPKILQDVRGLKGLTIHCQILGKFVPQNFAPAYVEIFDYLFRKR